MRAAVFLCVCLAACGASTGLDGDDVRGSDADAPCLAGARPSAGAPAVQPFPAAPVYTVVVDDGEGHAYWVGGLSRSGVYADTVGVVDTRTGAYTPLTLRGDPVMLPALANGVWDPRRHRAIVLAGTHGGADLAQAFALSRSGDTVTATRLPDLPEGAMWGCVGAGTDPLHDRVVVTAFQSGPVPEMVLAARGTYALALSGGDGWTLLVPGEMGPPLALPGEYGAMAYDGASRSFVMIRAGNRTSPATLWTLDAETPSAWRAGGTLALPERSFVLPTIAADTRSCGLLALATDGHCGFHLIWLGVATDGSVAYELRGDAMQPFSAMTMASGGVVFSPERDAAFVVRGGSCDVEDHWLEQAVRVPLSR